MDIRRKIFKALLCRVKSGERAEQRKMRRPDMCRNIDCRRTELQYDLQKIMAVQPKDRTAVGMDIPDLLQLRGNPLGILQPRKKDVSVIILKEAVEILSS